MILSGWILPDGSEIKCVSNSTLNGHIAVLKKYFNVTNSKDLSSIALDDYAITKLGWIKVINGYYKYVFYKGEDNYNMIKHYEEFGYTLVEI